jgi:hypothetical protein
VTPFTNIKTEAMKKYILLVNAMLWSGLFYPGMSQFNVSGLKNKVENNARQKIKHNAKEDATKKDPDSYRETNTTSSNDQTANSVQPATINTKSMNNTLSGTIIFSGQPFLGDAPANATTKDFKVWDEMYGRAVFEKPLKQLLTGNFSEAISNIGSYTGTVLVEFELKQDDGESTTTVQKRLKNDELDKSYIDFDIAPSINNSRDAWIVNFGNGVASYGSSYFKNREKGKFTMAVFFLNGRQDRIEGQNNTGNLTIDYSGLPDGDQGTTKISDWNQKINQAADGNQVVENRKKLEQKHSGALPGITFTNAKKEPTTIFQAGEEIYGRIKLAKPLREYLNNDKANKIRIDLSCLNENINYFDYTKTLRPGELDNAYIDFDIYPSLQNAKDVYSNNFGFFYSLYGNGMDPKKVLKFEFKLSSEYNMNYNGFKKMEAAGEVEIDYSKITRSQIADLYTQGRKIAEEAEKNAGKLMAKEHAEFVKKLPLPVVFTKASKAGYTGYSNAVLISMIKARFKVSEVYMLTFDVPEGSGDFTALKDLNDYPSEKIGNHIFYFAFKDDTDGCYKFAGGRLRMLYEGNGKYSDPVIFPYSPLMNEDPKFPFDESRYALGYESVFFLDGAKIKK